MTHRLRYTLPALAAVLAVVAVATVAYAAVVSNGVIHGCYSAKADKKTGTHALSLTDGTCPAGTIALDWNQTGPAGAAGPAGPAGAPGLSGWEMITATGTPGPGGTYATAICSPGKTVIGGGAEATQPVDALATSRPVQANGGGGALQGQNAWFGRLSQSIVVGNNNDNINVYAICANVS